MRRQFKINIALEVGKIGLFHRNYESSIFLWKSDGMKTHFYRKNYVGKIYHNEEH